MTVSDLIRRLQEFPPDLLVLKYRDHGNGSYHWDTMDGHWFNTVEVVPPEGYLDNGRYYEPRELDDRPTVEALEF